MMVTLYPVMIFVFGKLNGVQQTLFSLALPVLKLMFKNWASCGLYRLEDRAPVYVATSIDVFHTLLLSCAMQSAASRGTLIAVMTIDVFQSVAALVEVRAAVKRLERLCPEVSSSTAAPSSLSQAHHQTNILSVACSFLNSNPHIRNDPAVGLPRHRRQQVFSSLLTLVSRKRVVRIACASPSIDLINPIPVAERRCTGEADYVQLTLKLLHMVEFYMLIEFIEVVVATIYGMLHLSGVAVGLLTVIH
jgi:hypothetical protein